MREEFTAISPDNEDWLIEQQMSSNLTTVTMKELMHKVLESLNTTSLSKLCLTQQMRNIQTENIDFSM